MYIILAKDLFVSLIPPAHFFLFETRGMKSVDSVITAIVTMLDQAQALSWFSHKNQNQSPQVHQQPRRLSSYNSDHQMWAQGLGGGGFKSQHNYCILHSKLL